MSDIKFVDKQDNINLATQFGEYLYNRLPKVYRDYDVEIERLNVETQKKETFKTLQEYLYSFALGGFQPLLEDLEAIINLVDPFKCPSEFLPYLLRHFGLDYIDDIPEKFQRRLVQNVVTLYKKKGTIPAVAFLAKELSGFGVNIEEKSDGSIEFALIKLNAYEDEDAELLLAQDVIQRYIHLFLPAQTKSKIIVVYGFTENIHINPNGKSEDTTYDHAYYDVDEYEDITYIDENGYDSKTGGYSEAFDYLKHVVEDDFNALKLKLEEETHNFSPSLPDLTSLTNCVENDGLPVFTNGISCEDVITEQKLTSTTGEAEFNIPASTSNISVNKLVGGGNYAVLPIYKCTKDLMKGTTLEFKYDGKSYGYYTLERDLYASENFPTTFQLDIYNNMVKVYNQYFVETIDESYDFTLYSGYGSYYASMRNGFVATGLISDIRIKCDYDKDFTVMNSIYFQPTTTPRIAFYLHNVYISLSNVITSVESATEFVKSYPITIISPCAKDGSGSDRNTSPTGQTISYKKLSNTPVDGSMTIECTVYTMNDRKTVFAYESPVFTQNSNIAISGYYGLKTFPESHVISDNIQVTGHLTGVSLIDYKLYGNSVQNETPSPENPVEIQSVGDLVTNTSSKYYGKYDVPVTVTGKNLIKYPYKYTTRKINGITFTDNGDGSVTINGTATANAVWFIYLNRTNLITGIKSGDKITLSSKSDKSWSSNNMSIVCNYFDTSGEEKDGGVKLYSSSSSATKTVPVDWKGMEIYIVVPKGKTVDNVTIYPQLEKGSSATEYEPYKGKTKHIYLDEPLCKVGDYADYIDFKNQKVVRNFVKMNLHDLPWKTTSTSSLTGQFWATPVFDIDYAEGTSGVSNFLCTVYRVARYSEYKTGDNIIYSSSNTKLIYVKDTDYTDLETFKGEIQGELIAQLATPIEETIDNLPDIITTNSNTMYMYLGTSIQPSSIDITYYENTPVPQLSEIVYDLGIPLVSFDGYSESIEKIDGKYYLRSAIKEIPLEYMYTHCSTGGGSGSNGHSSVNWFNIKSISFSEKTPFYFNMSPCMSNVKPFNTHTYDKESNKYVPLPNYVDVFDFICFYYSGGSGSNGNYSNTVNVNQLRCLSGYNLEYGGLEPFKHIYNNMFRYSDVPPKFYIYDKYNKYGGETLTEITDKEVINKLNLLPIPEDYAIISSKGIKYSSMDISVQSKRYY